MANNEQVIIAKITEVLGKELGGEKFDLINTTNSCSYSEKLEVGKYQLVVGKPPEPPDKYGYKTMKKGDRKIIASFELHPMINCCGIVVSTRAEVAKEYRGKGLGACLNSIRIDIARQAGYGLLLCTDIEQNEFQRKILAKNGWKDIHKFINPRTKNTVYISVINL